MEISHAQLNKSSINLAKDIINLEEGDILKAKAGTANEITGQVSYLLIDRSQENG